MTSRRRAPCRTCGWYRDRRHRLGAPLARLEAEIAFTALLAGCPDLALAVDPARLEWRHSRSLRGLKRLPVTFSAQAARRADRSAGAAAQQGG